MSFKRTIISAGLMASTAMGHLLGSREAKIRCSAAEPSAEHVEISHQFAIQEAAARVSGRVQQLAISVNTYIHIVGQSQSEVDGITDAIMQSQVDYMNDSFGPSGISFTLSGVTRTVDGTWAVDGDEVAMKEALRTGDYSTLNLYFVTDLGANLGYCYFPTSAPEGSLEFTLDGCTLQSGTWPGGNLPPYDLGGTAVHEVGHWFGLYHTFQGGCSDTNDEVSDTPAQATATRGCPEGADTCSLPGLDPIHNFMDYSDDACYTEFTAGQTDRMTSFWTTYRG